MDTVLNLGLNDETVQGLAALTRDERFAYDAYRRFISMFGRIVLGIDGSKFDTVLEAIQGEDRRQDRRRPQRRYPQGVGGGLQGDGQGVHRAEAFPTDPYEQMRLAIMAVFSSWNGQSGHRLPKLQQDPPRSGHRRQRPDDGVWQHGQRLRHRRCLHSEPVHRREGAVRGVPGERPGRGRGGGHTGTPSRSPGSRRAAPGGRAVQGDRAAAGEHLP